MRKQPGSRFASPAFPDHQDLPAVLLKLATISSISVDVALSLGLPKLGVGRGNDSPIPTTMAMPKTPVDKDHLPRGSKHEIRLPWKCSIMQPISEAHPMNHRSHNHLRPRVLRPNPRHVERPLRFGMNIHGGNDQFSMTNES